MPRNTQNDLRTLAYVLRRTNYGEADRILNLITPEGKISAIAKSVRREKSKLAGGIEMFSLIDVNVHFGKNEMGVLTSAKMLKYHSAILKDFSKMEFAALVLKKVSLVAESVDAPELFQITDSVLTALGAERDMGVIEAWFWFNLAKVLGEQINLYRDVSGEKLTEELRYEWDGMEMAFSPRENGVFDADSIKIMRLMSSAELGIIFRIKGVEEKILPILKVARMAVKV